MGQRRRRLSKVSLNAFEVIVLLFDKKKKERVLTDFPLSRQAFRIRREETRKHNRQCQPPVRRAGPGSARLRHRQLRLQNDEAVKLPRRPNGSGRFEISRLSSPGLDDVLLFAFPVGLSLFPFSLFFSLPCWFVFFGEGGVSI